MGCGKRNRSHGRTIGTFSGMQEEGQRPLGNESGKDNMKGFYKNIISKRKIGESVRLLLSEMDDGRHREGGNTECLLYLRLLEALRNPWI